MSDGVRQVGYLCLERGGIILRAMEAMETDFSYREITKPLRPMGKATSLLLEILGLLCKSMVSLAFQRGCIQGLKEDWQRP